MARTPTNTNTTVEWQERVTDPDSDSLTLSLVLDAVDDGSGFTSDGTDSSNLSWLSFTKTENSYNGGDGIESLMDIIVNKSGLDQNYKYRFKITANDGSSTVNRTVTLSIEDPPLYSGKYLIINTNYSDVRIKKYGTAWDITSVTSSNKATLNNKNDSLKSAHIKPDGTVLIATNNSGEVLEFSLSTPFDINTASLENKVAVGNEGPAFMSPRGKRLYTADFEDVMKAEMSTSWDISTLSAKQHTTIGFADAKNIWVSPTGDYAFISKSGGPVIYKCEMTTSHDITTLNKVQTADLSSNNAYDGDMSLKGDLSRLYYYSGGQLQEYEMSSPGDLSTISYVRGVSMGQHRNISIT